MNGAIFDSTTGHYLRSVTVSKLDLFNIQAGANEIAFQGDNISENNYLDLTDPLQPALLTRTAFTITQSNSDILDDGIDNTTISLPISSYIKINGIVHSVSTGNYTFLSSIAGIYKIELVGEYQGSVNITVHSIVNLKNSKSNEIMQNYFTSLYSGVTYNGQIYDSGETSMNLISGAAQEGNKNGLPNGFSWKTQDNNIIPMSLTNLNGLATAVFNHINNLFAIKETMKGQLAAANNITDILNLDITTGF